MVNKFSKLRAPVESFHSWPLARLTDLHLEMGQQCNVRCAMCFQTNFRPSTKMPERLWKERLLPVYATARGLTLVGGEPTVLSNCRALVELVQRDYPQIRLNMATNGVLFTDFWEDAFLGQGACINFSLNAIAPELYQKMVKYGRQERVVSNINRLVRRKQESRSPVLVRISTVVTDQSVHELPVFFQWAIDQGLDQALVMNDVCASLRRNPAFVQQRIAETYALADRNPQVKLLHLEDFDWTFAKQRGIQPVRPRPLLQRTAHPCPIAFNALYVHSDGTVKVCCKSWYILGNLTHATLDEVWNSAAAARFRERIQRLDFRDCPASCDLNARPANLHGLLLRKAYWVVRRDPRAAVSKGLRRLGITNAQGGKIKTK